MNAEVSTISVVSPLPAKEVYAQDLHCGDYFQFRDCRYICFGCHTDMRQTMTTLFCVKDLAVGKITAIRLPRTFRLKVLGKARDVSIEVLDINEHEKEDPQIWDDLKRLRGYW